MMHIMYTVFEQQQSRPLVGSRGLIRATIHMVNREFGSLADDFVALGLLPPDADLDEIVPALTDVFSEALRAGVSNVSFGELSNNLGQTMYKYNFRIPAYYTLLVRSLSVLEVHFCPVHLPWWAAAVRQECFSL